MMMFSRQKLKDRPLDIERAISGSCTATVDTLYQIVHNLRARHDEEAVHAYSDQPVLAENIRKVDEIYLWFVKLKEEAERQKASNS